MRKYIALFVFIFSALFFLQTPLLFNQQMLADFNPPGGGGAGPGGNGITKETCTCDNAGVSDIENKGGQVTKANNTYTCSDGYKDHCLHAEEQCNPATGQILDPQPANGITGHRYSGVACQTTITCACNSKNQVVCTNPVLQAAGLPQSTYTQTFPVCSTDGSKQCEQSTDFKNTSLKTVAWNQPAPGAECQVNCTCDTPGKAGNKNNGWGHKAGSQCSKAGYCGNKEDTCENDPTAPGGHVCKDNTTCTCSDDKTQIKCISKGSGDNGKDQTYNYTCHDNEKCQQGKGINAPPDFTVFSQHVSGIACVAQVSPTLPPPPSPPCQQWSGGGVCQTVASGLGAFSTDPAGFVKTIFSIMLSISGGIALLLIIRAGYQLMTSQGKPEQIQQGRDQLIAAIVGLIFLIFSFVFLQLIGVDILHLPGFSGANGSPGGGRCPAGSCIQMSICTAKNPGRCNTNGCPAGSACVQ